MQISLSKVQINRDILLAHSSSIASRFQDQDYKLLSKWYKVPVLLNKLTKSPSCVGGVRENLVHYYIISICPSLQQFWAGVKNLVLQLTSEDIGTDPLGNLLHLNKVPLRHCIHSLTVDCSSCMHSRLMETNLPIQPWVTGFTD